jgi:two-component system NtrC family sensor kinase
MLSDDFYKRICDQASIGIIVMDPEFRILSINAAAAALFDTQADSMQGRPVEELVPEKRRFLTRRLLDRAISLSRPVEYRVHRNDGKHKKYLSIVVDPIRKNDEIDGVCFWVRDLTRRIELEKRLAEIEKFASMGQMAGGLAHHFNNIFGGIVTAVDHALTLDDTLTYRRTLNIIQNGIEKASALTRKLLDFSTPDLPEQNMADLTEVVINFVEDTEKRLKSMGRRIDLEIKNVPIHAVHPAKLRQILDILFANAEQAFVDEKGEIKITIDSDAQNVRLVFRDNGPGIPAQYIDRIFDPFFTTHGSLGGGSEGNLGLGLTVARRLAEDINGNLIYSPEESGNGTCFIITFPLTSPEK